MSLINQVLRDLDRHARPPAALPAAAGVAAVAAAPPQRRAAAVGLLVGLLAVGGLARPRGDASLAAPDSADRPAVAADGAASAAWPASMSASLAPSSAPKSLPADSNSAPWWSTTRELPPSALPAAEPPAVADDARLEAATPRPSGAWGIGAQASFDGHRPDAYASTSAASGWAGVGAVTGLATVAAIPSVAAPAAGSGPNASASSAVPAPVVPTSPAAPAGPVRIEKRAVASSPSERAEAAYRLGTEAQQRGDPVEAASAYAAALQEDNRLNMARVALAGVWAAQGRSGEAEELLQTGLAANPQQAVLTLPLARLVAARGELKAALGMLQAGLPGATGNPEYRACYGAVLQRAGRHREAAEHFNAALRLAPQNGVWWMGLGISLAADGRADAARSAYREALKVGGLSGELERFVQQRLGAPPDTAN